MSISLSLGVGITSLRGILNSIRVSIDGLTNGIAEIGDHAGLSAVMSNAGIISAYKWGSTQGGTEYGTGAAPTDYTAGDEGTLYLTVTSEGEDYTASASIRYAPPVASGSIPSQLWTIGQAITPIDMSAYVTGSNLAYSIVSGALPTGVTLGGTTISGTPSADDGTSPISVQFENSGGTAARGVAFTVSAVANIDALVAGDQVESGDVTLTYTIDVNSGVDVVITTAATTPTAVQIGAGQDHTGAAATHAFSDTWTTAGTVTISTLPALSAGDYYVHALPDGGGDADAETSNAFAAYAAAGIGTMAVGSTFIVA